MTALKTKVGDRYVVEAMLEGNDTLGGRAIRPHCDVRLQYNG